MTKMSNTIFYLIIYIIFLIIFILIMNSLNMNSMISLLILYASMIFITLSFWSKNYMYSIIMFLTLISGLLIIFLYFTSLISNIPNNHYLSNLVMMTFTMNMILLVLLNSYSYKNINNHFPYQSSMTFNYSSSHNMNLLTNLNEKPFTNIFNLYFYPHNNITLLCMLFLLLSMFSIIKICLSKSLPLRKISK